MDILAESYDSGMYRFKTHCCALAQLSINDDHTLEEIKEIIDEMREKAKSEMTPREQMNFGTHERAVFVITLDHETNLVKNLQQLGFEVITEFHRRNCYPENSMLTMWLLSW